MKFNLINDDCLIALPKMSDDSVDYTLTSPPYNRKRNDKYTHFKDINKNWYEFNCNVIDELLRVTKNHVFYNIQSNYYNKRDVYKIIGKYEKYIVNIFIWEKTNPLPASGHSITNAYEFFLILGDKPLKSNTTYTKNILSTSVNTNMPKNHKAVMKQEVADHFIEKFTKEGDHILDCFMGVGTTGISCKKMGRMFTGIEKELIYFEDSKDNLK